MDFTMCSCSVAPWSAKDMVLNCLDKDRSDLHEDMSWVAFEDRVCRGLFTGLHQGWMSHGSLQGHFPQHVQCHDRMITSSLSMSVMSDILHLKLASNQVVSWFQVHSSKSQVTVRRRGQMTVSCRTSRPKPHGKKASPTSSALKLGRADGLHDSLHVGLQRFGGQN